MFIGNQGLTKLGISLAVIAGLLTPSIIKAETIQPCVDGGNGVYKPCIEQENLTVAGVLIAVLELVTIKVAEDVLVGYLANIYGDSWQKMVKVLNPQVIANRVDDYVISIGEEKISYDDFVRRYR